MLSTLLLLGIVVLAKVLIDIRNERDRLKRSLRRYESISSKEEMEQQLDSDISLKRKEFRKLLDEEDQLHAQIQKIEHQKSELEEESYLREMGFYRPKYDFVTSRDYRAYFSKIITERKQIIKDGNAVVARQNWIVGEDNKTGRKQGKELMRNYIKTVLETFDIVCNSSVSDARSTNINRLTKRINDTYEKLNKRSSILGCEITANYLRLRLEELALKYEMELKKQEEKEREKLIREQMKKEKKERELVEKARQQEEEAAERKAEYEREREKIRQEMLQSVGSQFEELRCQIEQYNQLIAEAQQDEESAIQRRRSIKSGKIYVLSSIGSLEKDVYRVFMTQSSTPEKYIRNMNPYVPFPFNIRLEISSEDVSSTLKKFHEKIEDRRVNLVNPRREFFKIPLEEITDAVYALCDETTDFRINIREFENIPLEDEYLRTLSYLSPKPVSDEI
ncbi:MAG: DUF4041 domain-containing protein [Elainellaceae cyanobacterium]